MKYSLARQAGEPERPPTLHPELARRLAICRACPRFDPVRGCCWEHAHDTGEACPRSHRRHIRVRGCPLGRFDQTPPAAP